MKIIFIEPKSPNLHIFSRFKLPRLGSVLLATIAKKIGRPKAVRAVGAANGSNPIPIIIPCHRVIGADGSLTGFGGGLEIKRYLLDLESGQRTLI